MVTRYRKRYRYELLCPPMSPRDGAREIRADFARLYTEHAPDVFAAALRVVHDPDIAADITQDVFLDLWIRPERYEPERGELRPYLRLRGRSRALDVGRTSRARARLEERLMHLEATRPGSVADASVRAAAREEWTALTAAMERLPAEQREAVALVHLGGFTTGEVAVASSVPLGTAKSRVRLGLQRMRAELERGGAESLAEAA